MDGVTTETKSDREEYQRITNVQTRFGETDPGLWSNFNPLVPGFL